MQLPHDEGVHASPLEWWYFNGHVATEDGRVFSYHFVTFQSVLADGFTPRLAQLTWADHDMDLHLTAEQPDLPVLETSSGEFDLSIADWRMSGDSQTYHLSFQIGDYSVELEADARKPAVLHHNTGLVDLGIAGKTYYYSRTDLETSGMVSVSGDSLPVTGVSWFDHQWGDFSTAQIGWDWLSLNLDDGSDIMVSVVWEQADRKHIAAYGTYVPADSASDTSAGRRHLPGTHRDLDQPRHPGRLPHGLEPPRRLPGHGPRADPRDRRGRVRHQHLHTRDLLGGSSIGDGQQGWDRCIGQGVRRNGGLRARRHPIAPPTPHQPNPDPRLLDNTTKFDDANRIESAFGLRLLLV